MAKISRYDIRSRFIAVYFSAGEQGEKRVRGGRYDHSHLDVNNGHNDYDRNNRHDGHDRNNSHNNVIYFYLRRSYGKLQISLIYIYIL